MRLCEVRQDMQEKGLLPPDKRDRNNKGVRRAWKLLKRQEAEGRAEASAMLDGMRTNSGHSQSDVTLYDKDGFRRSPHITLRMRQDPAFSARMQYSE